jgi:hypothetical protein
MQGSLPAAVHAALQEFTKEQETLQPIIETAIQREEKFGRILGSYRGTLKLPATAILKFSHSGRERVQFHLYVLDRDSYPISNVQMAFAAPKIEEPLMLPNHEQWQNHLLVLSEASRQARESVRSRGRDLPRQPGASGPEINEPLGYFVDEGLELLTKGTGLDMIARIPDNCVMPIFRATLRDQTLGAFANSLRQTMKIRVDGAILMEPEFSEAAYRTRLSRSLLGSFVRLSGLPTIDDLTTYTSRQVNDRDSLHLEGVVFSMNGLGIAQVPPMAALLPVDERHKQRVYGLLSQSQRQALVQDGLQFGSLSSPQKDAVTRIVFSERGFRGRGEAVADPLRGRKLTDEPTLLLPSGIPASAMLRGSVQTVRDGLLFTSNSGTRVLTDIPSYARLATEEAKGRPSDSISAVLLKSPVAPVEQTSVTFTLTMGEMEVMRATVSGHRVAGPAKASWSSLPEIYSAAIKAAIEELSRGR